MRWKFEVEAVGRGCPVFKDGCEVGATLARTRKSTVDGSTDLISPNAVATDRRARKRATRARLEKGQPAAQVILDLGKLSLEGEGDISTRLYVNLLSLKVRITGLIQEVYHSLLEAGRKSLISGIDGDGREGRYQGLGILTSTSPRAPGVTYNTTVITVSNRRFKG